MAVFCEKPATATRLTSISHASLNEVRLCLIDVGQTFLSAASAAENSGSQECLPHESRPNPQELLRS
jgi:hypothetical protein